LFTCPMASVSRKRTEMSSQTENPEREASGSGRVTELMQRTIAVAGAERNRAAAPAAQKAFRGTGPRWTGRV